jgi:hypothetical protein
LAAEKISRGEIIEPFATLAEVDGNLPIELILHFEGIADYREPTTKPPLIVRTRAATYHCIDGWNLIEEARRSGQRTIRCRFIYVERASEFDLAIMKATARFGNRGPEPTYAEILVNVRWLRDYLTGSATGRTEDIEGQLATRLNKDRSTITDYINRSKYLTAVQLTRMAEANANKRNFESLARYARRIKNTVKSRSGVDRTIVEETVSNAVSEMVDAFVQNGIDALRNAAERLITDALANATSVTTTITATQDEILQVSEQLPVAALAEAANEPRIVSESPDQAIATDSTLNVPEGPASDQARARFKNVCIDMVSKIESMTDRQLFDEASRFMTELVILRREIMKHLQQTGAEVEGGQS